MFFPHFLLGFFQSNFLCLFFSSFPFPGRHLTPPSTGSNFFDIHCMSEGRKKQKKTFETCARVLEMSQTMWGRYKRVSFIFAAWLLLIYFLPLLLWWWPPLSITSQIDSPADRGEQATLDES
jgi:hypothetical protein